MTRGRGVLLITPVILAGLFAACTKREEPAVNTSNSSEPTTATKSRSTIGVYRPEQSVFYLRNTNSAGEPNLIIGFGLKGDIPVVGDWDGNGPTTIGVYRPSQSLFLLRNANSAGEPDVIAGYGMKGDVPIVGDWDGNGTTTIGVYRPDQTTFYLRNTNSSGEPDVVIGFGVKGDLPVVMKAK